MPFTLGVESSERRARELRRILFGPARRDHFVMDPDGLRDVDSPRRQQIERAL